MNSTPLFLDVNVPMYAAGIEHRNREACVWILHKVADGRLPVAIDTEIIQEILHRYSRLRQPKLGVQIAASLLDLVPIVHAVTPSDSRLAVRLFDEYSARGVKDRHVIHAAVMQNNGLTEIISTDKHFDLISGIRRLDPQVLFDRAK